VSVINGEILLANFLIDSFSVINDDDDDDKNDDDNDDDDDDNNDANNDDNDDNDSLILRTSFAISISIETSSD